MTDSASKNTAPHNNASQINDAARTNPKQRNQQNQHKNVKHSHKQHRQNTKRHQQHRKTSFRPFSEAEIKTRKASVPPLTYPSQLPVSEQKERIATAIRENQVVILAGETGSGKTTQLPKICLEVGRGIHGMIGHTQPRRIATRSVAERISTELGVKLGSIIGYQVRFTEILSRETLVKLMTDGILLAEIQADPLLHKYDTIIIDEAHERSLNIDFLLGYLAQLLPQRPDLKLIITSATIDSQRFAEHFAQYSRSVEKSAATTNKPATAEHNNHPDSVTTEVNFQTAGVNFQDEENSANALSSESEQPLSARSVNTSVPIIEVSGRTYPVEIRYRPLDGSYQHTTATPLGGKEKQGTEQPTNNNQYPINDRQRATQNTPHIAGNAAQTNEAKTHHLHYASTPEEDDFHLNSEPQDQVSGIIAAARELMNEGPGDILVFLSGEGEIRETQKAFQDELGMRYLEPGGSSKIPGAVEVLPLFARLSSTEQHRIFQRHNHRRIILATNIAETSLTVPGIRYVIDPGTARISRYSNKTKVQRLPIEPISQASANQRAGRCGRVADGIAIRLYSADDYASRPEFTEPEIQRTSLAAVILQMAALNLGAVADFPFIDPPDIRAVRAGEQLLTEIGALEIGVRKPRLTQIGRKLARLPIDPRLGRMLLAANENGCAAEVLVLVAAMSVQDVRERPLEFKTQADQLHARFTDPSSDFLAYLHLWRYLRTQQRELSGSAFRRMCRAEYLHWLRFREWEDVVDQLRQLAKPLGITLRPITIPTQTQLRDAQQLLADEGKDSAQHRDIVTAVKQLGNSADVPAADAIHQSLLVGMLSNLGNWDERKHDYAGARGTHFVIWPGSGLYKRTPAWVMAAELVETSRLFARTVARIDSDWIERAASHLLKHQYSEPYWSTRNGAAMAHEKITLYGMTVVADRPVLLSKVGTSDARALARELFIRHGLVENQWRAHHKFIRHNAHQLEQAREVETRLRQYGLVADENTQFRFFDERLPETIVSARHFDSWWKKEQRRQPELLNFTQEFLLGTADYREADYPQEWVQGEIKLPISYGFQPGAYADGLSIEVPVTLLPQLRDEGFDWLVPGMLPELVQATIRALPKPIRRNLVPAPDVAREILQILPDWQTATGQGTRHTEDSSTGQLRSFQEAFSAAVRELKQLEIPDEVWNQVTLPPHLEIKFVVRSERGAVLDEGPSLTQLQRDLAPQTHNAVEKVVKGAVEQALEAARAQILADISAREAENTAAAQKSAAEKTGAAKLTADIEDLQSWPQLPDGVLPELVESAGPNGATVRGYPALVEIQGTPKQGNASDSAQHLAQQTPEVYAENRQYERNSQHGSRSQQQDRRHVQNRQSKQNQQNEDGHKVGVALRVLADPALQVREHQQGLIRLLATELALPEGRVTSRWNSTESLLLATSPYPNTSALVTDLQLTAVRNVSAKWAKANKCPLGRLRTEAEYLALRGYLRDRIEDEIYRIAQICARIFSAWSEASSALRAPAAKSAAMINTVEDVRRQMRALIFDGFIMATPDAAVVDLIRYLQGVKYRLEKAPENLDGDAENADIVAEMEELLETELEAASVEKYDPARAGTLEQVKWMIQELRISLFAQPLGTKMKVSPQRIRKLLAS